MTSIFLSYSRLDDETFVRQLYDDLTSHGFDVWFDRTSMPSRQLTFYQEIRDAIVACDRLLLVIGPQSVSSEYVTQEWTTGLELDKCVNPIVRLDGRRDDGSRMDGYSLIPDRLALFHAEDFRDDSTYAEHFDNLKRQLSEPAPRLGKLVSVPTLPLHYLAQREHLSTLKDILLSDLRRPVIVTGAEGRVGVQGMGGIGKSVLAAALARDFELRRAFPDGVFWISISQQPNLVKLQRFFARELGDVALFDDLLHGKQKLWELLADRAVLLILDDVWQSTDVAAFDALGPRCRLLLTTRDFGVVSQMAGTGYRMALPNESEALAMLAKAARIPVDSLPPSAEQIVAECGRLPLALALCGGMAAKGHLWERILRVLRDARLELIADRHEIEEHHRNIWRTMEISVQVLPPNEQRRFAELAVFATDASTPEQAVLTIWSHTAGLTELDAANLLVSFSERSLIQLDRSSDPSGSVEVHVSLHDLLHDFATHLAQRIFGNLPALHNQVLDAYAKQCSKGWSTAPDDGYFFHNLRHHLIAAGRTEELMTLMTDLNWLEAKAENGFLFDLLLDFAEVRSAAPNLYQKQVAGLLEEAIRRECHFIARHYKDYPQALFQCLWNLCWWYDSPDAAKHYTQPLGGWSPEGPPWERNVPKLFTLLESWRTARIKKHGDFVWLRSLRPPLLSLSGTLHTKLSGHGQSVTAVTFSYDDHYVISSTNNQGIYIWDVRNGELLTVFRDHLVVPDRWKHKSKTRQPSLLLGEGGVNCLVSHPSAEMIAAGSFHGAVRIWSLDDLSEVKRLVGHQDSVLSVDWSLDGKRIGSGSDDGTVRVWNFESGVEEWCFKGHDQWVGTVSFSPDGLKIASGSGDRTVRIWDLTSGQQIFQRRFRSEVPVIKLLPNGELAIAHSRGHLAILDSDTGRCKRLFRRQFGRVTSLTTRNHLLALGYSAGTVQVIDLNLAQEVGLVETASSKITSIAFSGDMKLLACADYDNSVHLIDWSKRIVRPRIRRYVDAGRGGKQQAVGGKIAAMAFSPAHDVVVTSSGDSFYGPDQGLSFWSTETGLEVFAFPVSGVNPSELRFSPDGKYIYGGGGDWGYSQSRIWRVKTGRCVADIVIGWDEDTKDTKREEKKVRRVLSKFGIAQDDKAQGVKAKELTWSVAPVWKSPDGMVEDQTGAVETNLMEPATEGLVASIGTPFQVLKISNKGLIAGAQSDYLYLFQLEGWKDREKSKEQRFE